MDIGNEAGDRVGTYARLEAFLAKLQGDVYPELPSGLHTDITGMMFKKLQEEFPLPPGAQVLDIGCGQGVALELFREAGLAATGIALGEDVEVCRAKGHHVVAMNMSFLDFTDCTFDLIWCRHALEHSIFPLFTISEMHRILKPGGVLYVEVPAPDTSCRHEENRNHYSVLGKRMWLNLLQRSGFADIRAFDLNFRAGVGPDTYFAFMQRRT
jgi:SAM-dependent methyltransferase